GMVSAAAPPKTKVVEVRSTTGAPFRVVSVRTDTPAIKSEIIERPNSKTDADTRYTISLTVDPEIAKGGNYHAGSVLIDTDSQNMPTISVPWSAFSRNGKLDEVGGQPD